MGDMKPEDELTVENFKDVRDHDRPKPATDEERADLLARLDRYPSGSTYGEADLRALNARIDDECAARKEAEDMAAHWLEIATEKDKRIAELEAWIRDNHPDGECLAGGLEVLGDE